MLMRKPVSKTKRKLKNVRRNVKTNDNTNDVVQSLLEVVMLLPHTLVSSTLLVNQNYIVALLASMFQ